jgi:integrase
VNGLKAVHGILQRLMTGRRQFGTIRKRPSGRWQAFYWHQGTKHYAPNTFKTKADASAFLDNVHTDITRGGWVDPRAGKVLFAKYATEWLSSRPDLRPRTVMQYESLLKCHLIPVFGRAAIADVTPSQVRTWHAALSAAKPGAARTAYRLLRAIFSTAVHDERLLRNPCKVQGAGSDRVTERPIVTVAEVAALSEAMPPKLRLTVTLAAWGALRRGEVLALRRRDIDPLGRKIRVVRALSELNDGTLVFADPKSDAGIRTVHLPDFVVKEIEQHLESFVDADPDALLFTGRGEVPPRMKTLSIPFQKARATCGLRHVRFHDLRHFSLTMAATTGASTKELMRRGGHSTHAAALRYQHATEDRDKSIADALGELVQGDVVPITTTRKRKA